MLANIVHSSAMGEKLNAFSVRSSLANKLGIKGKRLQYRQPEQTNGLAEMMLDAITQLDQPLSLGTDFKLAPMVISCGLYAI